ncbi:MAG: YafY family protein [Bacteroidota bacterium]
MKRLERLTIILIKLQSKRILKASEIASEFDISLRTVYRDMKTLESAGLPLYAEAGVGYRLVEGYSLPPMAITEKEALALLTVEKIIGQNSDFSLVESFSSLIDKIRAILKAAQKNDFDYLEDRIAPSVDQKEEKSRFLLPIQQSIKDELQLTIHYRSIYSDKLTIRNVDPLAVYFTKDNWLMIAYCHLRDDYREFRLDRIEKLSQVAKKVRSNHFSLTEYFGDRKKN